MLEVVEIVNPRHAAQKGTMLFLKRISNLFVEKPLDSVISQSYFWWCIVVESGVLCTFNCKFLIYKTLKPRPPRESINAGRNSPVYRRI